MKRCLLLLVITILLISNAATCALAAEQGTVMAFPYSAQITGDNVNIRSGPGTNYYICGQLNKGDVVKVVAAKYTWSKIVPPKGFFSWISKQYVEKDPTNPSVGIVTGDNVRVRAGRADGYPLRSYQEQGKLSKDERVRLMGEERDDYYKIYPPSMAYVWVETQYVSLLTTPPKEEVIKEVDNEKPAANEIINTEPTVTATTTVVQQPTTADKTVDIYAPLVDANTPALKQYYAYEQLVKQEHDKPLEQQDYSKIKKALVTIAENKDAKQASKYAAYLVKRINGFELAAEVDRILAQQKTQLNKTKEDIAKDQLQKMAEKPRLGKYAVIGTFQPSEIYNVSPMFKHFKILDPAGNILCYALPTAQKNYDQYVGQKVGLVGIIEPHIETKSALVRFSEITELN